MEHVIVIYPTRRLVYIDGVRNGYTNEVLRIDAGTHIFDLGEYANYVPTSQEIVAEGTSVLAPIEVTFTIKEKW